MGLLCVCSVGCAGDAGSEHIYVRKSSRRAAAAAHSSSNYATTSRSYSGAHTHGSGT